MNKKDYVIKVLELLKDTMPLAKGLVLLLKKSNIDETFLDVLIKSFQKSIDQIDDEKTKELLNKSKMILTKLKEDEQKDKELDDEELKELDKMIENI